jgi:hypothetical protein
MIRNISLLFVSMLFVHLNIQALDQDLLDKAAQLLEHRKIINDLKQKPYPGKYDQKRIIDERQYLENKKAKLLAHYEQYYGSCLKSIITDFLIVGVCIISAILFFKLAERGHKGRMYMFSFASSITGLTIELDLFYNYFYIAQNPPTNTELRKKEALLKMLDRKINKYKKRIEEVQCDIVKKEKQK